MDPLREPTDLGKCDGVSWAQRLCSHWPKKRGMSLDLIIDTGVPDQISHIKIKKTTGTVDIILGIEGTHWDLSIILRIRADISQAKLQRSQGVYKLEVIC